LVKGMRDPPFTVSWIHFTMANAEEFKSRARRPICRRSSKIRITFRKPQHMSEPFGIINQSRTQPLQIVSTLLCSFPEGINAAAFLEILEPRNPGDEKRTQGSVHKRCRDGLNRIGLVGYELRLNRQLLKLFSDKDIKRSKR